MHAVRLAPFAITGLLGGLLGGLLAGCAPTVPYTPTWTQDVKPILLANCARCHSSPPIGGAPDYFRLDLCKDTMVNGRVVEGAGTSARSVVADLTSNIMPPRFKISQRQKRVISNWYDERPSMNAPAPCPNGPAAAIVWAQAPPRTAAPPPDVGEGPR